MDSTQLSAAVGVGGRLVLIAVTSMLVACAGDDMAPWPSRGQAVRADCPPLGEDDCFFPAESLFPADPERDYERRLLLSNYLATAGATSLSCSGDDAYRVIWLGGYNEPVLVLTVAAGTATAVEFLPFNVAERSVRKRQSAVVSAAQLQQIAADLDSAGLWIADPVRVFESEGSSWTFEGRRAGVYRALTRTHPDARLAEVGRSLVVLAGLSPPRRMSRQ